MNTNTKTQLKAKKVKLAGICLTAFLLSAPSFKEEAVAFNFTAPSAVFVKMYTDHLARQFEPSKEEKLFIKIAKIP